MLDELIKSIIEETVMLTLKKAGALQQTKKNTPDTMTVKQLVEYIGMSESWIYQHTKKLPHTKVGRKTLFVKSEIDEWREQQRAVKVERNPRIVHVTSVNSGKTARSCYKVV